VNEEVEITRGLIKSGGGTALQLTGTTSVSLRAESGSVDLLASGATTIVSSGGALSLTGTAATLESSSSALALTGATSVSLTAVAAGVALTGATTASITASAGDATITALSGSIILNGKVQLTAGLQVAATVLAASGTVQGDATTIATGLSMVSVSDTGASEGVVLPTASVGARVTLLRATLSNAVNVYPAGSATINGAGASVALPMSTATNIMT
jgi:hypothetical protein